MGWNVILDALLGLVPAVGDLADAAHRANVKNLRLLERTLAEGRTVDVSSRTYLVRAILMVVVILAIAVAVTVFAIWAVLRVLHIVWGDGTHRYHRRGPTRAVGGARARQPPAGRTPRH